jgi:TonB-dependent Receptor Plug Domain
VEASGFKKYLKREITLFAQDKSGLPPISLALGAANEATVEANAAQLQTVRAERSGVLTGTQMVELASNTRNFTDLLKNVPGFNADRNNANGLRTDENAIAVDGTSVMDVGNNSAGGWRMNSDIIAEFKVLTDGQPAEFGRAAASNITVVTKSAARSFTGSDTSSTAMNGSTRTHSRTTTLVLLDHGTGTARSASTSPGRFTSRTISTRRRRSCSSSRTGSSNAPGSSTTS